MENESQVTEIVEEVTEEIIETVEEIAEEIIAENDEEMKRTAEINKSIIDAMINSEEYRQRMEFENRVMGAIDEIRNGLITCQNSLETLQSQTNSLSATAAVTEEIAETALEISLTPETSSLPAAVVDDPAALTAETINPQSPPDPVPPPPQNLRAKLRRLL